MATDRDSSDQLRDALQPAGRLGDTAHIKQRRQLPTNSRAGRLTELLGRVLFPRVLGAVRQFVWKAGGRVREAVNTPCRQPGDCRWEAETATPTARRSRCRTTAAAC